MLWRLARLIVQLCCQAELPNGITDRYHRTSCYLAASTVLCLMLSSESSLYGRDPSEVWLFLSGTVSRSWFALTGLSCGYDLQIESPNGESAGVKTMCQSEFLWTDNATAVWLSSYNPSLESGSLIGLRHFLDLE
jgi:hypothetical protein